MFSFYVNQSSTFTTNLVSLKTGTWNWTYECSKMNEGDKCSEKLDSNINIQSTGLLFNYKGNACPLYNIWIT